MISNFVYSRVTGLQLQKETFFFGFLLADGQGVDPGRHDRVRETAAATHPGPGVITSLEGEESSEHELGDNGGGVE